jgi:NAD(P)-dependent dehydrogenase (short-subunit alcohol dehydrogenase family)
LEISDTTALVTGAASGLGAATAAALAAKGARVVGLDLSVDRAPRTERVSYLAADVTDSEQVRAALANHPDGRGPSDGSPLNRHARRLSHGALGHGSAAAPCRVRPGMTGERSFSSRRQTRKVIAWT